MTISRVKEIIEKRFQITLTRNRSYQLSWRNGDERILVSNIRSDYMIVEIENSSTALLSSFADEKQLIKILNSFVNIAGELNKNNKMKRKHTQDFVIKIVEEFGYTLYEVRYQVNRYLGSNMSNNEAIEYLRQLDAESIRFILRFNKL